MSRIESAFIRFKPAFETELKRFIVIGHNNKVNLSHGPADLKIKFSVMSFKKWQVI